MVILAALVTRARWYPLLVRSESGYRHKNFSAANARDIGLARCYRPATTAIFKGSQLLNCFLSTCYAVLSESHKASSCDNTFSCSRALLAQYFFDQACSVAELVGLLNLGIEAHDSISRGGKLPYHTSDRAGLRRFLRSSNGKKPESS